MSTPGPRRQRKSPPRAPAKARAVLRPEARSALATALARAGPKSDLLGQPTALLGVVRRHHRIVGSETPALAVLLRGKIVRRLEMAFQHFQFLAVLETDEKIGS